jgi:8-oxo-dGTP diphosphatase
VFRGDDVLLIQRGKGALAGLWSLPGGHIEPGETTTAAAAREVLEETSVAAAIKGVAGIHDVILHNEAGQLTAHYVIAVHFATWIAGEPHAGSDAAAARFVPIDCVGTVPLTAGAEALIRSAFRSCFGRDAPRVAAPTKEPEI